MINEKDEIRILKEKINELEKENQDLKAKLNHKGRKKVLSETDRTLVILYRQQGYTYKQLSKEFNCSTGTIFNICNDII